MEKKVKRSGRPPVGRVKARRDAARLIINPTVRKLIHEYPQMCVFWLTMFDEFGISQIIPAKLPPNRRHKATVNMVKLTAYGLAEQLDDVKMQSWGGRPAKVYRLLIP